MKNPIRVLVLATLLLSACATSSPVKDRLDKNFVYNCSLELIHKNISPADAERICTASHQAELQENRHMPVPLSPRAPASVETDE